MSTSQNPHNEPQAYDMADLPKHDGLRPGPNNKDSSNSDLPDLKQEENQTPPNGRVAGGSFLESMRGSDSDNVDDGPLKEVNIDMPETRTELITKDGGEYILLHFANGDPENPFNWPTGKKVFITLLLCMMTLFIGLATTAYSSGITSMCDDFGVSTELGQLGLFCFNMACALAPLFLAPFCELVGRKIIYTGAYAGFIIVFIGLALGKNIATILVMRTLSKHPFFKDSSMQLLTMHRWIVWLCRHNSRGRNLQRYVYTRFKSRSNGMLRVCSNLRNGGRTNLCRIHR